MDWGAALGGVSTALTIVKQLREVDASMNEAVHKAQLVTLMEQLSDVKIQMIDAREEARERDAEIARLKAFDADALTGKAQVHGFYLDTFEDGSPKGEPYCPYCIEKKAGLFRVRDNGEPGRPYQCPNCKTKYTDVPAYFWEQR